MSKDNIYEKILNESVSAFNKNIIKRPTESDFNIISGAMHRIEGIKYGKCFMVEPLLASLLEHLPKPVAKEVFKEVLDGVNARIESYCEKNEAENTVDVAISHNRRMLREVGIPKEHWKKYGGEWED